MSIVDIDVIVFNCGDMDGWPGTHWLNQVSGLIENLIPIENKDRNGKITTLTVEQQVIDLEKHCTQQWKTAHDLFRQKIKLDFLEGFLTNQLARNRAKLWLIKEFKLNC